MKITLILIVFSLVINSVHSQDSASRTNTTLKVGKPKDPGHGTKRVDYFRDTIRRERRKFDSTLFTTSVVKTTSDYADELGRVYQMLTNVPGITGSFVKLKAIHRYMDSGDTTLGVIKERMNDSNHSYNVRNLLMFNSLLDQLDKNTGYYASYLYRYDTILNGIKKQVANFQKDTLMLNIFRDSILKTSFQPQLQQLKSKWRQVDSLITENSQEINTLKSQASAHSITVRELLFQVDQELANLWSSAFRKERRYLWEAPSVDDRYKTNSFSESMNGESELTNIYFSYTGNKWLWLPAIWSILFFWISSNFYFLSRRNKLNSIDDFHFVYIRRWPVVATVIVVLTIAPLFDLHAPMLYVESLQFLLAVCLTSIFYKRLGRRLFFFWCIFVSLFVLLLLLRALSLPLNTQRWVNLFVHIISVVCAVRFLSRQRKEVGVWASIGIALYTILNFTAIVCNLLGRVTLFQILGLAAAYSLAQVISLMVFVKVIEESFLLQIETSRIRKNYNPQFDYAPVLKSVQRLTMIVAIPLWLLVFVINLNVMDAMYDLLSQVLTTNRKIGSFSFTWGGVILFVGIIWIANFLQKYIAYFFGDTGDDVPVEKGHRSRLVIIRLVLVVGGFLLAIAASGLAVDRITVVLGALGVGIGLGLQGIVNNFVSGIILIFDGPLRIGDTVEIGDKHGTVKAIGIRTSTLLTEDGADVIIPNGDLLSRNIINWTLDNNYVRETISFNIDRPANLETVDLDAIKKIVLDSPEVVEERSPKVVMNIVNAKTVEIKIFFWTRVFSKGSLTVSSLKTTLYHHLESKGLVAQ